MYPEGTAVIAHRGASAECPENTLRAYERAVQVGADLIEIDLHETRDGAVVVTHDSDLRSRGGPADVGAALLHELRRLDMGEGEPLPTLDEVLEAFGSRIPFNLELKRVAGGLYPGLVGTVVEAVRSRGWMDRMLFSSFYDPILHDLRARAPEARIGLLVSARYPHGWAERARALGAEALHPELALASAERIGEARRQGLRVHVFTVNEEQDWERLVGWGATACFTDHPGRLRTWLDART